MQVTEHLDWLMVYWSISDSNSYKLAIRLLCVIIYLLISVLTREWSKFFSGVKSTIGQFSVIRVIKFKQITVPRLLSIVLGIRPWLDTCHQRGPAVTGNSCDHLWPIFGTRHSLFYTIYIYIYWYFTPSIYILVCIYTPL